MTIDEEKGERFDVNCVVDDKDQIDVEMQGSRIEEISGGHENFFNKSIYYLTDLHSSQKSRGIEFYNLVRTYQVTFSGYTVFPHRIDYVTRAGMRTSDGELISKQINMIIIELSKLGGIIKKPIKDMTSLEMWSVFLGLADKPNHRTLINEMIKRKEVLGMAGAVLTSISKDEHERAKFMSRHKAEFERTSNLLTVEKRGIIKGRAEGRVDAIIEVARKMKMAGKSYNEISIFTELTIPEIERL